MLAALGCEMVVGVAGPLLLSSETTGSDCAQVLSFAAEDAV